MDISRPVLCIGVMLYCTGYAVSTNEDIPTCKYNMVVVVIFAHSNNSVLLHKKKDYDIML